MNPKENKIIYLFCVTEYDPNLSNAKKLLKNIYAVQVCDFFAVLGTVDEKDFGDNYLENNIKNIEWLSKHATIHEKIIEAVMLQGANVIPFKFATLFYTQENLEFALFEQKEKLIQNFRKLKDKEEWGVKIYCNTEFLLNELTKINKEIVKFDNEINTSKPGRAYILKKKRQDIVKEVITNEIEARKIKYFNEFKVFSIESKMNKNHSKELTGRKDEMILNAVFLVKKEEITNFLEELSAYKNRAKSFIFEYTGPWPPYNFI